MHADNPYRCFRYVQFRPGESFADTIAGWLELAEAAAPGEPKALLEERGVVFLQDGTTYRAVSFKASHGAVGRIAAEWSRRSGRGVARVADGALVLEDGRRFSRESLRCTDG